MRTNTKKLLGAVAVAGLVATGGSAFTAGGLSRDAALGSTDALGGQITQSVTGEAVLNSIDYGRDASGVATDMTLTFAAAVKPGQTVEANGVECVVQIDTTQYLCSTVDASNEIVVSDANYTP